jgi:hypothetical protein
VSSPSDFPEKVWPKVGLVRPEGADLAQPWVPHAGETIDESYETEDYVPVSLVAELVEASQRFLQQAAPDVSSEIGLHPERRAAAAADLRAAVSKAQSSLGVKG